MGIFTKNHGKIFKKSLRDNSQVAYVALFLNRFGEYPSTFSYDLKQEQKIDLSKIDEEGLKKIFPDLEYFWQYAFASAKTTSSVEDFEAEDEEGDIEVIDFGRGFSETSISVFTKRYLCVLYAEKITIYHRLTLEEAKNEVLALLKALPVQDKPDNSAKVQLVCSDGRDYYTTKSNINKVTVDMDTMYNEDFKPAFTKIENFLKSRESGIVLLHGEPGTGKTTFIRHLVTNIPKEYVLIPNGMMPHIASPEFISFIMDHKNSVFILEDCEQILQDRSFNQFNNGISTILNMSDGILSDVFNIKFICTFNSDMESIDKGLLRKGRCYANYTFGPLSADRVAALAAKNNIELDSIEEMTLAEVFNAELDSEDLNETKKKIGF